MKEKTAAKTYQPNQKISPQKIDSEIPEVIFPDGRKLRVKLPPPGEKQTVFAQGRIYELDSEGNLKDNTPPPVFDNPVEERMIGMAVEGGSFIPAFMKGMTDDEVFKVLTKPVVINPDDSEDVRMKKGAVADLKEMAIEYIEEGGGTFAQFADEMAAYAKEERELKHRGLSDIMHLLRENKVAEAKAYKAEFDQIMAEQGFPPLRLPKKFAERMK